MSIYNNANNQEYYDYNHKQNSNDYNRNNYGDVGSNRNNIDKDNNLNINDFNYDKLLNKFIDFINKLQDLDVNIPKHHKIDKINKQPEIIHKRIDEVERFIFQTFKNNIENNRHKKAEINHYLDFNKPIENLNFREENVILKEKIHYLNKENQGLRYCNF